MYIGQFDTTDPNQNKRWVITTAAAGLNLTMKYVGRPTVDGIIPPDNEQRVIADLRAAFPGKINVEFNSSRTGKSLPMIPSLEFCDVIEFFAAFAGVGGRVFIDADAVDSANYTAHAYLPFSNSGCLRLGDGAQVIVTFEAFTEGATIGDADPTAGTIDIETHTPGAYSNTVAVLSQQTIITGQTAQFSVGAATVVGLPSTIEKVTVISGGIRQEITADNLRMFSKLHCKPHFNVMGWEYGYDKWLQLNTVAATEMEVKLSQGNNVLIHRNMYV